MAKDSRKYNIENRATIFIERRNSAQFYPGIFISSGTINVAAKFSIITVDWHSKMYAIEMCSISLGN